MLWLAKFLLLDGINWFTIFNFLDQFNFKKIKFEEPNCLKTTISSTRIMIRSRKKHKTSTILPFWEEG